MQAPVPNRGFYQRSPRRSGNDCQERYQTRRCGPREIVEGFFFRRLRAEDGRRIERLLVKSPPGLGKTTSPWPPGPRGDRYWRVAVTRPRRPTVARVTTKVARPITVGHKAGTPVECIPDPG
jgi:hypothetical protein